MIEKPYVVLHGGFHKTATSHIQSKLTRNSGYLDKNGVRYIHHRDIRRRFTVPLQANAYQKIGLDWSPKISDLELAALTRNYFGSMDMVGVHRLVVSDENLAGHCGHCVKRGVLYRWQKRLILNFSQYFPFKVHEVHLGVRNYADFFAAAYVEFLRSVREKWFIDEAQMKQQVLENMPNWHSVLKTVLTAFPEAKLNVWRYEDFETMEPVILKGLAGEKIDISRLRDPKTSKKRPTASGRAVKELLRLFASEDPEKALESFGDLQEEFSREKGFARYDPWSAEERRHMTRMYDRDIARITLDPGIDLITV